MYIFFSQKPHEKVKKYEIRYNVIYFIQYIQNIHFLIYNQYLNIINEIFYIGGSRFLKSGCI